MPVIEHVEFNQEEQLVGGTASYTPFTWPLETVSKPF